MSRVDASAMAAPRLARCRGWVAVALVMAGCGGGGGGSSPNQSSSPPPPPPPAPTYTVSATVTGLSNPVVLQVSGAADVTVNANGPVTLLTGVASGASYAVSVRTQPANPRQECVVTNGDGTVIANVDTVAIQCADVPLVLTSSSPSNAAIDVARENGFVLTFSAPLNAVIPSGAITLQNAEGAVPVSFSVSGNQIVVTPSQRLLPVMAHTLTASEEIRGAGGDRLVGPVVVTFTTRDGAWAQAQVLAPATHVGPSDPDVAFDAAGNAVAIWQDTDLGRHVVKVQRHIAGSGWESSATQVGIAASGIIYNQQLGFDANGNGMALWFEEHSVRANRYVAGTWTGGGANGDVVQSGSAQRPQLAVDADGNAMAVWMQFDGTRNNIRARRYVSGSGWAAPASVEFGAGNARFPQIGADAAGNAILVWEQTDGTRDNVWANRYVAGVGWSGAVLIESGDDSAFMPIVAVHAGGDAIAVWEQTAGAADDLWANRYVAGVGWTGATRLETAEYSVHAPSIAFGANGDAIAVWQQGDGVNTSAFANRYIAGSGWSGAIRIESSDAHGVWLPQVAVDARGNAIAWWSQSEGAVFSVWANRYIVGRGWGSAMPIETGSGTASEPHVAIDRRGNAIAVWIQHDGTSQRVWTNRFE